MSIKVLLVTGSYPPMKCGIGDYTSKLARALSVSRVRVGVLTSVFDGKLEETEGIKIFPVIKKWQFRESLKAIKIIRSWSADIVHIQHPTQGYGSGLLPWILPIISFLMRKKVVQTWHEAYGRRKAPKLFLKSMVPASLVFVRPQYKDCLHPMLSWALWNKKIEFIPSASCIPRAQINAQETGALRKRYLNKQKRLIVFFGFVYPHKGAELLFDIADPDLDQIVIAGVIDPKEKDYLNKITQRASTAPWAGKVTITDFLPAQEIAALLAVADAVILPFRDGGGEWNTSIHGAVLNGAFVVTTSLTQKGYDNKRNVYFTKIDDIAQMQSALAAYAGTRRQYDPEIDKDEWLQIAERHRLLYEGILSLK
jgi:glycosyltransferase involved in cell wall biosynthesis